MVHLLLGHTGISGADAESETERFCNDVASEYLLPSATIESFEVSGFENDELATVLGRLSNEWKVSRSLIAYRLHRSGKINGPVYRQLVDIFSRQWNERRKQRGTNEGGPNPYVVKRHRIGNDPFIVAYALAFKPHATVVSTEVSRPSAQRGNRRLPDVCQELG